jgi:UDP-GlcNAc:undecaprenyl-phosphate/decaprenyl-phosphate GlcNAc-1-phosphate transferase
MSFPFNVYCAAFLSACVVTLAATPLWIRWCLRTGLVDDPGHRKIHHTPVPLAGGLAVVTGLLIPLLASAALLLFFSGQRPGADELVYGLQQRWVQLGAILLGALGIVLLGGCDDKLELRPLPKFSGQLLIALLVAASGTRITLFVPNLLFSYVITILWLLTVINAFNFMDNMNGLCAGLGIVGAACFGCIAALQGHYLVAGLAFLGSGALAGFLPYNFPKARAFLGDAGSHLVGYLLAILAILPHFYSAHNTRRWAVLTPLLVLAIPLLDLAWVVLLRWRHGKPFYIGDTNHLSHRLVRSGLTRPWAVAWIWFGAAALGALAVLQAR